jgi:hypothetical protein
VLGFFVTPPLESGRRHSDPRHGLGFSGGLGDLLATAALGSCDLADEIRIAIALDSWQTTVLRRRDVA